MYEADNPASAEFSGRPWPVGVWQNAIQLQGFLLTGGLDAPAGARPEGSPELSRPEGGIEAGEMPGIGAGTQSVGVREPISAGKRN